MSIKPEYVEQIFAGTKTIEFRRRPLPDSVKKVVVYSITPVAKIVGYFEVDHIEKNKPSTLWRKYHNVGGIEKKLFDDYYKGVEDGYGILIKNYTLFKTPKDLNDINKKAPQSYVYLTEDEIISLEHKQMQGGLTLQVQQVSRSI